MEHITSKPIDIIALLQASQSAVTGAVVLFSGEVRNRNKGREVSYLEYEAFEPLAENKIAEIVAAATARWNLNHAICLHRTGKLEISESAVVVITASAHRSEAYEANRYIIDKVKAEVPIWKKEYFTDGTYEWGNNSECSCAKNHTDNEPSSLRHDNKPPFKLNMFLNT